MPAGRLSPADRASLLVLTLAFAASRALAWVAGVRFDAEPLTYFWQYADPDLLRDEPLRTLWWFHAQPPAYNGFLALGLQLPEPWPARLFAGAYLLCGGVLAAGTFLVGRSLGAPRVAALVAAAVFTVGPATLAYEHLLFYPYPVAAFLVVTFAALARYLRTGAATAGALCFAAAALTVLTRTTYHLVWLAAIVAVAALARPDLRRRTAALAALPLVLAAGLYVKNAVQFDTVSGSSWLGMNLARVVRNEMPDRELTGVLATPPFSPPEVYGADLSRSTGVRVLDQLRKPGGEPNFNHAVYPEVSHAYLRASLREIRAHPLRYLGAVGTATRLAFAPATNQPFVHRNVEELGGYADAYNRWVGGAWRPHFVPLTGAPGARDYAPRAVHISWTVVVVYVLAIAVLPLLAWNRFRAGLPDTASRWVAGAAGATVAMALVAGVALELGENSRFRFETDALALALAVTTLVHLAGAWRTVAVLPVSERER